MSGLFGGGGSIPKRNQFMPPPQRAAADVQAEVASERMRRAAMRGRGSTLLTADATTAAPDARKTLLGE